MNDSVAESQSDPSADDNLNEQSNKKYDSDNQVSIQNLKIINAHEEDKKAKKSCIDLSFARELDRSSLTQAKQDSNSMTLHP